MCYRVVALRPVLDQLRGAPPPLQGYVEAVVTVLRIDPQSPTAAFETRVLDADAEATGYMQAVFADGNGLLTYRVLEHTKVVVLYDVSWAG